MRGWYGVVENFGGAGVVRRSQAPVANLVARIEALALDQTGMLLQATGEPLPW